MPASLLNWRTMHYKKLKGVIKNIMISGNALAGFNAD